MPLPAGRCAALNLSPQQQRQQTQDVLVGWLLEGGEGTTSRTCVKGASEGRQAIGEAWRGLVQLPGLVMTLAATRIEVSEFSNLTYDVSTYALDFDSESSRINDNGKYVVV